jgi:hypothetical protein
VRAIAGGHAGADDGGAMDFIWWAIGVAVVVIWVLTIVDIVRRHMDMKHTAAWVLIVVLLPFLGAVAYWAMRKPTDAEIQGSVDARTEMRERSPYDRL